MLSTGSLTSLLPRYAALPTDSGTKAQRLINTSILMGGGDYPSRVGASAGVKGYGTARLDQFLPELRLPVVTWDQPAMQYAGDVTVWLRDDPIIRHLAHQYHDERVYEEMRTTVSPIANSLEALTTELLGVGYGLIAKRERRKMPAVQTLRKMTDKMLSRLGNGDPSHLHSFLEIASQMLVFDGWLPVQTWWSPYKDGGKSMWGPDRIFEMPQQLFGVDPNRKLVWLGYSMTDTLPQVLDGEADSLSWMYFSSGSTRSPYGRAMGRKLWLTAWIYEQALEWHASGARNAMQGIPVMTQKLTGWPGQPGSGELASQKGDAGKAAMKQAISEARETMRILKEYGVVIVRGGYDFELKTTPGFSDGWGKFLEMLRLEMVIGVEGQHLTAAVGSHGGSRATADVQAASKLDRVRNFGRHADAPINELIRRWMQLNFKEQPDPDDVSVWGFHLHDPINEAHARVFLDYGGELDAEECASRWGDLPVDPKWIETGGVLKLQPKATPPPGPDSAGDADKALAKAVPAGREPAGIPEDSTAPSRQAGSEAAN
jgi:hypothetical protein